MFGIKKMGNTHIPHFKGTATTPSVTMTDAKEVLLPLSQHIGAPATPVVAKGEPVYVGSVVGKAAGFVSADIHSGVSGIVDGLTTFTAANGLFVALRLLFHRVKGGDTICLEHPCGEAPVVLVKQNNQ